MPGRVLIADDSGRIQKELAQLLQDAGFEVTTVSNGEHAVRKLPTFKPDLVLADIFMPVRTGYEVCQYIRQSADFAETPVLLLASKMEPYDEKEAQRVGASGRIEKPFENLQTVLATVQKHMANVVAAQPPPPIDEFAQAVPVAEEESPEPVLGSEMFTTRPEQVEFDEQNTPVGFTEMVEEEAPISAAIEEVPPDTQEAVDLSGATMLTTAAELRRRIEEERAAQALKEQDEALFREEILPTQQPSSGEASLVEKPELAAAWEMTGPEPGAPEIKPAGGSGWDSQWAGEEAVEEATTFEEAPAQVFEGEPPSAFEGETAAAEEPVAADLFETVPEEPAAVVEEEPAPAAMGAELAEVAESATYPPEQFAADFAAATGEPVAAPEEVSVEPVVEETIQEAEVAAGLAEELAAAPSTGLDPAVVEEVVNQVLARLSPQVMETIAREIVRPLAESLLREKLRQ